MKQVQAKFKKAGLRVSVDRGAERLAKQIRVAGQASVRQPAFDGRWVVKMSGVAIRVMLVDGF